MKRSRALYFKKFGAGGPIIILHGLFGCWDNWYPVAKALSRQAEVYVVDQRNHGQSFHSCRCDYDAMAVDIHSFMKTHGLSRASLLGHSMGGKTAMRLAAMFPAYVDRLVIVDITHQAHAPHYAEAIEALWNLDLGLLTRLKDADERLKADIPEIGIRLFLLKNLQPTPDGKFRWKVNLDAIRRHYAVLCGPVEVRLFLKPCLFIRGGKSNYVRDADRYEIQRFFPQAQLTTVENAGHWVHTDDKEAFLQAVEAFISGTKGNPN
jgi:pimeloyl-ACP methyl ester carboxylesterase